MAELPSISHTARHQGEHTCIFYESEESLVNFLVRYFSGGLRKGEYCFGAQKPERREQLFAGLRSAGIDVEDAIRRGCLEIHSEEEVYFPNGQFNPQAMMDMLGVALDAAQSKGFSGLRTAGDLSWAPVDYILWDQVLDYEKLVNEFIPGKAFSGVCQYRADACTASGIEALVEVHRSYFHLPSNSR